MTIGNIKRNFFFLDRWHFRTPRAFVWFQTASTWNSLGNSCETNCIKFEYWNLHPQTRSTSVPIRYNIHVAHNCVLTLWTVNRTIYFIANFRRPLQILILKATIHLLQQNHPPTYVSSDWMTVNRSTNINAKLNAFSFSTFKGLVLSAFQLLLSVSQISV